MSDFGCSTCSPWCEKALLLYKFKSHIATDSLDSQQISANPPKAPQSQITNFKFTLNYLAVSFSEIAGTSRATQLSAFLHKTVLRIFSLLSPRNCPGIMTDPLAVPRNRPPASVLFLEKLPRDIVSYQISADRLGRCHL